MDRDSAIVAIKGRLKRSSDSSLDASIISEMQIIQTDLEKSPTLPWFLVQSDLPLSVSAGVETVTVPTGFLREVESDNGGGLWLLTTDSEWIEIPKDDLAIIRAKWPSGTARPIRYALSNETLFLRPIADVGYSLRMNAYIEDDILSSNIENKWLKHAPEIVIAMTTAKIAGTYTHDKVAEAKALADAATARGLLDNETEARLHSNRSYSMGDD